MAPLLLSYGQQLVDEIRTQQLVEEYFAKQGRTTTVAPAINVQDNAEPSIESSVTNECSDVLLDQSNNGFSLVNLHRASFSTGLSSVLTGLFIAGCCYFRGRRQCQSAPAIQNSCTPSLLQHPDTSAPFLALNPVSTPALLPTPPIPPMQLGLLPTPSPTTRLLLRPHPVASPIVRLPTSGPSLLQPPWSLALSAALPRGAPGHFLCRPCPRAYGRHHRPPALLSTFHRPPCRAGGPSNWHELLPRLMFLLLRLLFFLLLLTLAVFGQLTQWQIIIGMIFPVRRPGLSVQFTCDILTICFLFPLFYVYYIYIFCFLFIILPFS